MEILAQTTHWGVFWFVLIIAVLCCLLALFVTIGGIVEIIRYREKADLVFTAICGMLVAVFAIFSVVIIKDGPDVTFQAKVTDFNAVYKHGYEIVDQDGKLFTIRKEAK